MKSWHLGIVAGALMSLIAAVGWAQEVDAPPVAPIAASLIGALDADGDGVLSAAEITGAAAALQGLDADGDGAVSTGEMLGERRGPRGRGAAWRRDDGPHGREQWRGRPAGAWRRFMPRLSAWMATRWSRFPGARLNGGGPWASRSERIGRPWPRGNPVDGRSEFAGPRGERAGERLQASLFDRFDEAGNGYLDASGVPERVWERLAGADADGDGRVTPDELTARFDDLAAQMRERWSDRHHDRRHGRRDGLRPDEERQQEQQEQREQQEQQEQQER